MPDRPLRVAQLAPAHDHLWIFWRGWIERMRAEGLEVHGISSPGPALDDLAAKYGLKAHAIPISRRISPWKDLVSIIRVWLCLLRTRPQIAHAHTPKGGLVGMIAAWLAGVPVRIFHVLGTPLTTSVGPFRTVLWLAERIPCALAHQVYCVSDSLQREVIATRTCRAEKTKVLLSGSIKGVDAVSDFNPDLLGPDQRAEIRSALGIPANALVLGFVGRLIREKGVVELAQAWRELRGRFDDLHMLIVGPAEQRDAVPDEWIASLRGDPRVHLVGPVDRRVGAYYSAMDVVVLPTHREGLPHVILEAGAMGLPTVATRVTGCVDAVVDGVTGTLVPPRDAEALAAAIRMYLTDPELRRRHGQAGRERVLRDFQPARIWDALYEQYVALLRERQILRSVGNLRGQSPA